MPTLDNQPITTPFPHKPVGENLLVLPDPNREFTDSDLKIPGGGIEADVGTIVAKGPLAPNYLAVGDRVMWAYKPSIDVTVNGVKYFIMHEFDFCLILGPTSTQTLTKPEQMEY